MKERGVEEKVLRKVCRVLGVRLFRVRGGWRLRFGHLPYQLPEKDDHSSRFRCEWLGDAYCEANNLPDLLLSAAEMARGREWYAGYQAGLAAARREIAERAANQLLARPHGVGPQPH